jgi:serine/threonine protein kinase
MMDELHADDPAEIGPYRLLGRLGSGAMGTVYLATSPGGRAVAVKLVRPSLATDPAFRARFAAEVAAVRAVSGAFTSPVVDAAPDADQPWLATAYVPGPTLQQAVQMYGPLPESSMRVLGVGLAEALAAIHTAGLIHRDLNPSNILLSPDGPRVIDFGISHPAVLDPPSTEPAIGKVVAASEEASQILGSAGFVPPEYGAGVPFNTAGDIFAFGVVLCYASTGHMPFGTGPLQVVQYRAAHQMPDLDGIPGSLARIIAACLDPDPARRPSVARLLTLLAPQAGAGPMSSAARGPTPLVGVSSLSAA